MKNSLCSHCLITLGALSCLGLPCPARVAGASFDEPEDSPLFAESVHKVFAQWAAGDATPAAGGGKVGLGPDTVILVEGRHWQTLPGDKGPAARGSGPGPRGPRPMSQTMDVTCLRQTMCVGTTCAHLPTCGQVNTCAGVFTCVGATCGSGGNTCAGTPTCAGTRTCVAPTCAPNATCGTTCEPTACQTTLEGVTIPQPGQIQMSFASSSSLHYTLQYCTNLTSGSWAVAATTNGTGGLVTLCHTNNANLSFYRLLIQSQ